MAENTTPTVETSLSLLSNAIAKAAEDLLVTRDVVERARLDIASRNTSVTRNIVRDSERVIDELRRAEESLRDVVKDLQQRD